MQQNAFTDHEVLVEILDLDNVTVKEHLSKLPCALVWRHLSITGGNVLCL